MTLQFGRDICGALANAERREWLVTNGIGGYGCGSISGLLARHYHGLLVAALKPPLERTLLLAKLDETVYYADNAYSLHTDRWADGTVSPQGYLHIEQFHLDGTMPVWTFACGDALLEKRIWMEQGANTTYIRYTLKRASQPIVLSLKTLVNYRNHHGNTQGSDWQMQVTATPEGIEIQAFEGAVPFYLAATAATVVTAHAWYQDYTLATEQYRGIYPYDDHLHAATFEINLAVGQSFTLVASTLPSPSLDGDAALKRQRIHEQSLIEHWSANPQLSGKEVPRWLEQLALAADQFIVDRTVAGNPGKTVIAGYPWFGDWGRDTMIALPGLAISTNRPDIAQPILHTFAQYLDQGMLPNLFPEAGETPEYNTVDAILWYFEAIRAYDEATQDRALLSELFPILAEVIDWHQKGTRYNIHLDTDGLIYAGEPGVQLTWMDAKIGDWVVTPRIGKPIEISALWYNALLIMAQFAQQLGKPADRYQQLANQTLQGFQRFWNADLGYCYDVLDGPLGNDDSLRPNQIFAIALPAIGASDLWPALLSPDQQKRVVDVVSQKLVTSYGLRSLLPDHADYKGHYGGAPLERDGAYHQGPVWGWLIGPFVQAHLKVYKNPVLARSFLDPMADHLRSGCIGTLSEIFDGDPPHQPRGAFAQAWTVAEVLRTYLLTVKG
ncbi:MAG: amylo-alpha-1,6-glucosidase [Cyanobacteria bacterium P01_G01_bin.38]